MPKPRQKGARRHASTRRAAPKKGKSRAAKKQKTKKLVPKKSAARKTAPTAKIQTDIFATLPVVLFSYQYTAQDNHGFLWVSEHVGRMLGIKAQELVKETGGLRLHPDDVGAFDDFVLRTMAAGEAVDVHLRILLKDSAPRWIHFSAWPQGKANNTWRYTGVILNIDARKKVEAEQSAMLARMEEAQDIAKLGWYDFNVKSRMLDLTNDFAESLGLPLAPSGRVTGEAADKYVEAFMNALHPDDRERYTSIIADESWRRIEFDYRVLTRSNEVRHLCSRIQRTADKSGKRIRDFAVILDITERKRLEEDLRAQAGTDPLTGVPNRRSFEAAARREVERARRYAKPFAVIALDIDFFKKVNDTHGHDIGDIVLKDMTKVCLTQLRLTDVLARLGGEEFAALLPETDIIAATKLAERLRVAVASKPIATPKGPIAITVSLGVAQYAPNEGSIESALKRADEALYEAKNTGRDRVVVAKLPSLVKSSSLTH
ncbi:MAG: sensor domain-containing diguanylate cyclase [Rhodospirillaceae bacterium]|nr:sensor domain-containing diguanylate cyclase [Rhodospirillaceae bacterium]